MKQKKILIATIIFFLIVNTQYYWEGKMGLWAIPFFLLLVLSFFLLLIVLLFQTFLSIKEKFVVKSRIGAITLLIIILGTTYFFPRGLFDFDKLNGEYVMIASREGAANCMTTLKLNEKMEFKELITCFGTSEIKGKYEVRNDTIFFKNIDLGRHEKEFYEFAILVPCKYCANKKILNLMRYKNKYDTVGHELSIQKNILFINK